MSGGEPSADDLQQLARAYHEDYRAQFGDGGRADVAWDDLPDDLVEANLASARAAVDHAAAMGFVVRRAEQPTVVDLPAEVLEQAARAEHDRWVAQKHESGWTLGPRDAEARTHPDLVPWEQLDEPARDKDRVRIVAIPRLLAEVGLELVPAPR